MVRSLLPPLLAALCCLVTETTAQARFAPGELLVGPAQSVDALHAALAREGLPIVDTDTRSGVACVRVPVGQEPAWAARLRALRAVAYVETNGIGQGGLVPNDTSFPAQWHLQNTGQSGGLPGADIRATDAWDITTGSTNVVIAVLDTGIDTDHPEFAGRIDPDGYDFVNEDPDPEADHPHGSSVAGCSSNESDHASSESMRWRSTSSSASCWATSSRARRSSKIEYSPPKTA